MGNTIQLAQSKDKETVKEILYQSASWLNDKGSKQWAGLLKGEDVHNIEDAIKNEEVFLVYRSSFLIGTFALWDTQTKWDSDFWGEDLSDKKYYLHRIALAKEAHGKNLGKELVTSAMQVANENKKDEIRLDCIANNSYLNSFYKNNGFSYYSTVHDYYNGEGVDDYNLYIWKVLKKC